MFQRILIPLDGSRRAERALPLAARIARFFDGTLLFLRVVCSRSEGFSCLPSAALRTMLEVDRAEASAYLQMMAVSDELCDVHTVTEVQSGPAAATILAQAEAQQADLIVLCRYGQTGRTCWPLGGVAEKVIHGANIPVLLISNAGKYFECMPSNARSALRGFVPLDGSYQAEAAFSPTAALAMALSESGRASICLMHVVKHLPADSQPEDVSDNSELTYMLHEGHTYLRRACDRLAQGIDTTWNLALSCSVFPGYDVAETLLQTSERSQSREGDEDEFHHGYDLIAMTTCGRGGMLPGVIGSVIGRLLRTTTLPLFSVCPPKLVGKGLTSSGQPSTTVGSDGESAPVARFSG